MSYLTAFALLLCIVLAGCGSCTKLSEKPAKKGHVKIILKSIQYGGSEISNGGNEWKFDFDINGKRFNQDNIKLNYLQETLLNWVIYDDDILLLNGSKIEYTLKIIENDPLINDKSNCWGHLTCNEDNIQDVPIAEDFFVDGFEVGTPIVNAHIPVGRDIANLKLKFEVMCQ